MAILSSVILLAQNASSSINTNLQDSENMLQNANQELDVLKDQYNNMLNQPVETSFFNFSNLYFWLVLVGLLLLAFGLLFLLAELQNRGKKQTVIKKEPKEEAPIEDIDNEEEEDDEEEPELDQEAEEEKVEEELEEEEQDDDGDEEDLPKRKSSKPIKIKVQKIK